jgi:hypothetical protein
MLNYYSEIFIMLVCVVQLSLSSWCAMDEKILWSTASRLGECLYYHIDISRPCDTEYYFLVG